MILITSHPNTDFDGLASMVAASKLYENSVMYMPWTLSPVVKKFHTLFKYRYSLSRDKDVDFNKIQSVVIVDAMPRVLPFGLKDVILNKKVKVCVYTHHPTDEKTDIPDAEVINIKYGACTTYFVEQLINKNVEINQDDALLFLLGIYSDTGNFLYPNTTPDDLKIASFLHGRQINNQLLVDLIQNNFETQQTQLLNRLLKNLQIYNIKGFRIIISFAKVKEYISQLSDITTQILAINGGDAIVTIAQMQNKIFLTARSKNEKINVKKLLDKYNGGGHRTAASAIVHIKKGVSIKKIRDEIYRDLNECVEDKFRVRDIMSSPVRAVSPSLSMEEAYKICIRFNNNGLPVVKDGKLTGFITKQDIEKGILHKLGHIPVSGYMTKNVITISPDTHINEAQRLMLEKNIGHLPVVENGVLIGILTRTDVLSYLYEDNLLKKERVVFKENDVNIKEIMEKQLLPEMYELIKKIGEYADEYKINAYLVGGLVRDIFLKQKDIDVDITVEGDGIKFAKFLADKFNGTFQGFERFKTGKVFLKNKKVIDVTSARAEFYEFPAALPEIEFTPVRYDLFRRDFTINAMAIKINKNEFGKFIDYFDGFNDLKNGIIRTLYNMSFIDDPTRILRAIRFEQRFNFNIEENTLRFIKETLRYNIFNNLPGERLRDELLLVFNEEKVFNILTRMQELGVIEKINNNLTIDEKTGKMFDRVAALINDPLFKNVDKDCIHFMIFMRSLDAKSAEQLCADLKLKNKWKDAIVQLKQNETKVLKELSDIKSDKSKIFMNLKKLKMEVLFYFALQDDDGVVLNNVKEFISTIKNIRVFLTGEDLKNFGIKQGPVYREILDKLLKEKIDGRIKTREQEINFVKKMLMKQ